MTVWAIVYSNYTPWEVDSLWSTEEKANERMAELKYGSPWKVVQIEVG